MRAVNIVRIAWTPRAFAFAPARWFACTAMPPTTRGPSSTSGKPSASSKRGLERLVTLQELLYAEDRWSLLLVFQAMDAAGKDSAIKHVMSGLNPQGTQVYSFKRPSDEELDHDYLWRSVKALARTRPHRHFQPLVLRGSAGRQSASGDSGRPAASGAARDAAHLVAALRGHQRVRTVPLPQRHGDSKVLPPRVEGGAAAPAAGAAGRAGEELEVSVQRSG